MQRTLFASDLHLAAERPAAIAAFTRFLETEAVQSGALYLLGDLFEYWVGDDDLQAPAHATITRALASTSAGGTRVFVMHGNRDFLMGEAFCDATGVTLLEDPVCIELCGQRTVLTHGDALCTDDLDYQAWRHTARSAGWQRDFLAAPLATRRAQMDTLRARSRAAIRAKPAAIMDVNDTAVRAALRTHQATRMIHGHTHRPAHHRLNLDGLACERWVLPEWYGPGGYLLATDNALRLVYF
ncbi:MAG: UDP-2,3-diacylglucosamine diphosphatase [Proteobacteria bacterium]|nr:UDP-2,3-diacylglucosamine diphosphatase [Pseudomonadota bacterium]